MGIHIKYTELFSLSIEQLFYKNKAVRDTRIDPKLDFEIFVLPESLPLIKRMNLLTRNTEGRPGIVVLAPIKERNPGGDFILRYPDKKEDKIGFGILLNNPDVLNQNDLPLESFTNKIFYFNNNISDPGALRSSLHLSKESSGVKAADQVKSSGPFYKFQEPSIVGEGNVELKHIITGRNCTSESLVVTNGETDLFFNLTSLPAGKCELKIRGDLKDTFYYRGTGLAKPLFAIAEFYLTPTLESNYRIIEADGSIIADRPAFVIRFVNRKTVWRYTFQLQESSQLFQEIAVLSDADKVIFRKKLNVVSNDAGVIFVAKAATERRLVFESENFLFLKEKYVTSSGVLKLNLEKNIGLSNQAVVKNNLPFPSTGLLDTSIPSFVYSDIFLTI